MRKLIVLMLLAMVSSGAAAAWVKIGSVSSSGGYDVYVDRTTIRRSGNMVKMRHMFDYKTVQTVAGERYLSATGQNEYDCKHERSRLLYFTWHSGNMGKRDVVTTGNRPSEWTPVPPGSVGEVKWKVACGKK